MAIDIGEMIECKRERGAFDSHLLPPPRPRPLQKNLVLDYWRRASGSCCAQTSLDGYKGGNFFAYLGGGGLEESKTIYDPAGFWSLGCDVGELLSANFI